MGSDTGRRAGRRRAASGRFVLRLAPGLHALLRSAAAAAGVSLNDYCARKLASPGAGAIAWPEAARIVERAAELLGEHLVGIVVYGSWARGDVTPASDVDVLIVVEDAYPLTRASYRRWDEKPLEWDGRPVEPHFVRLSRGAKATALWAEAATDGMVLFERGFELSARLAEVRGAIAAGRIVRRTAHGQPYWAEVA